MSLLDNKIFSFFKSLFFIFKKDITLQLRNFRDIITLITFFIISVLIFIFAIGPDQEKLNSIGIAIFWTLLILACSITINKSLEDDYVDGTLGLYQFSGISFEIIAIIKILTSWISYQLPFIIIIPLASIILSFPNEKIYDLVITMLISTPILTILMIIASSMMLTNRKNLMLASLIILPLSIPIIIFSVGAITSDKELFLPQIYILLSILMGSIALGPWIISSCIKIAIRH